MFCVLDMLSKEEFHLKQNVEPFIHYREKHTTFECITRENIEAVAAKVPPVGACFCDIKNQVFSSRPLFHPHRKGFFLCTLTYMPTFLSGIK